MPKNILNLEKDVVSTGMSKKWNKKSFDEGFKTTFKISKKESGSFIAEGDKKQKGILCEMRMTQDASIPFGETNLILPEAITLKSKVLIAKDMGTILEWSIQSRKMEIDNEESPVPETEIYMEIARHIKETK